MISPGALNPRILPFDQVSNFPLSLTMSLFAASGGAGASAALEALRSGAKVLVLERAGAGGGATAMSSCENVSGRRYCSAKRARLRRVGRKFRALSAGHPDASWRPGADSDVCQWRG